MSVVSLLCIYFCLVVSGGGARLGSPAVHNGPMGGASPRAGQRRQQAESPDPAAERGMLHCTRLFFMNHVLFFPVCCTMSCSCMCVFSMSWLFTSVLHVYRFCGIGSDAKKWFCV